MLTAMNPLEIGLLTRFNAILFAISAACTICHFLVTLVVMSTSTGLCRIENPKPEIPVRISSFGFRVFRSAISNLQPAIQA